VNSSAEINFLRGQVPKNKKSGRSYMWGLSLLRKNVPKSHTNKNVIIFEIFFFRKVIF